MCVATLAGAVLASIPGTDITLSWTHSVEKTEWREAWRIEGQRLVAVEARIRSTGAGMEPPADARLVDGWWVWRPDLPPLERIVLAASSFTADHSLCVGGDCRPLHGWTGPTADRPIVLEPCR
nr:DUF1850 domain-containing protein [Azospirillum oleiclasticum]